MRICPSLGVINPINKSKKVLLPLPVVPTMPTDSPCFISRLILSSENLDFLSNVKLVVNSSNRPLVIFPQATRMNFNDRSPFKKGVSRIYDELKIICLPIAINSGTVWPKTGKLVSNRKIIVSILDPIMPGQDQKAFLDFLQDKIYKELDNISKLS